MKTHINCSNGIERQMLSNRKRHFPTGNRLNQFTQIEKNPKNSLKSFDGKHDAQYDVCDVFGSY